MTEMKLRLQEWLRAALIREGLTKAKRYLADIDAYEIDKENNDMPEFDLKNHALIPRSGGRFPLIFIATVPTICLRQ